MESDKYYFFWKHQFGQWTKREIKGVEGIRYNCCEQYMMYNKAILFNDFDSAKKILLEEDPAEQQKLGRKIKNFNEDVWCSNRERIVYDGNYFKFTRYLDLRGRLIDTYPKLLVEASPSDLVWGVGLTQENPLILDPKNWRGQNLLGKVLTKLRNDLIGV